MRFTHEHFSWHVQVAFVFENRICMRTTVYVFKAENVRANIRCAHNRYYYVVQINRTIIIVTWNFHCTYIFFKKTVNERSRFSFPYVRLTFQHVSWARNTEPLNRSYDKQHGPGFRMVRLCARHELLFVEQGCWTKIEDSVVFQTKLSVFF